MKVDRETLEDKLLKNILSATFLSDYAKNTNKIKKIIEEYIDVVIVYGIVNQSPNMSMTLLTDHQLFHLARALYEVLNVSALNPSNYFTDDEMQEFMMVKLEKKEKLEYMVLENVVQLDNNTWLCPFMALSRTPVTLVMG